MKHAKVPTAAKQVFTECECGNRYRKSEDFDDHIDRETNRFTITLDRTELSIVLIALDHTMITMQMSGPNLERRFKAVRDMFRELRDKHNPFWH